MFANSDNQGGTDWALKTVPEMWSMIAAHDGTAHKSLLLTWLQSADLLIDHLSRVKRYRDNLAEAWPPDKSKAAAKYLDRLDDLISHLTSTYEAAVENHRALGAATSALVGARVKMESIYRAYLANQQDLDAYAAKLKSNEQIVGKYRIIAPTPPTAESRQLELHLQAQSVMSALSTDLAQAQLNITTPALYDPVPNTDRTKPFDPENSSDSSIKTLTSPSPSSNVSNNSGTSLTHSHGISSGPTGGHSAVSSTPSYTHPDPPSSPLIPILSGLDPTKATSTPVATNPISHGLNPGTGLIGSIPVIGTLPTEPHASLPAGNIGGIERSPSTLSRARKTLPGGIIGDPAETGGTHIGPSLPRNQQLNPSGGIIGSPTTPIGSSFNPRKRSNTTREKIGDRHWSPDDPWAIEEGIDPVILPPEKQKIDPGPAIGLP
ncbi:hypothetical protein [Actinoplanes sp. NPDC020271]|uniref:hypothetical protein n=1 Tax=Actinoplanes sp. NPDC020271 TaxID=3363896 RepID=UPI00379C7651